MIVPGRPYSCPMEGYNHVGTGHVGIDSVVDGLRLGDNVVWQTEDIASFKTMVGRFVAQARHDNRRIIYIRFGNHDPLLDDLSGVRVHSVDPSPGFESFATAVHHIVADEGLGAFYVFDSLTDLLRQWRSDLMVMNFFKVTCPHLYDLDTVAYFCLLRGQHTYNTIAGIRETTQLLLDLYHIGDETYLHPLKVWSRYSPTMFFPHQLRGDQAISITSSDESARLFARLNRYRDPLDHWRILINDGWAALASDDPDAQERVRRLLVSLLIGRSGQLVDLALDYLTLPELLMTAERQIGTGYIGGKSVGMLLSRAIAAANPALTSRLAPHDSFFLGSDLFFTYIIANGWWKDWVAHKTPAGYHSIGAKLHDRLGRGRFPPAIREQFLQMLEYFGQSPIIVRSSSLLEDNYGNAFAGKYDSIFCANQGTPEERHRAFEDAVRAVYASAVSPEALAYREHRGLVDSDEQMAVLVQRVSGDHHGDLFFPHAAGVGNSHNLYVYDARIDPSAGMLRLVFGLGTRAVDRIAGDYARIVTLDDPRRPVLGDATRYTQRYVDVLSLPENALVTKPLTELRGLPLDWSPFLSTDEAQVRRLRELGRGVGAAPMVCDFGGLLASDFGDYMREVLRTLSAAYDYPVDVEFTVNLAPDGDFGVCLVQCRPLQTRGLGEAVKMPDVAASECFIKTSGGFMGGNVRLPISHVVLVRPAEYLTLGQQDRYGVARAVGAVNAALASQSVMLIGPGRWGTTTPSLGVPVTFTEINKATALVEVTYAKGGFAPELSYGSHFFQDLVESGIFYATVCDDRPGVVFRPERVCERPNLLSELAPAHAELAGVVHVAAFDQLALYSDIVTQRLMCV